MSAAHGCDACRTPQASAIRQVGNSEYQAYFSGKGHETTTRFECVHCGARWLRIVESGAGGHGNNWNPDPVPRQ